MSYPTKIGLWFSGIYVTFILICIVLALLGMGITMWLVLFTAYPTFMLMKIFGWNLVISGTAGSNAYQFVVVQIALIYGLGYLVGRLKGKKKQ
jgi:hypothetical protein